MTNLPAIRMERVLHESIKAQIEKMRLPRPAVEGLPAFPDLECSYLLWTKYKLVLVIGDGDDAVAPRSLHNALTALGYVVFHVEPCDMESGHLRQVMLWILSYIEG